MARVLSAQTDPFQALMTIDTKTNKEKLQKWKWWINWSSDWCRLTPLPSYSHHKKLLRWGNPTPPTTPHTLIPTQKWIVQGWEHRASWFREGLGGVFCDYDPPQWLVSTSVAHLSGSFLAQWLTCWRALKILRSRGSKGSRSLWCHLSIMIMEKQSHLPRNEIRGCIVPLAAFVWLFSTVYF